MQVTNRRIYLTWQDASHRLEEFPLYEDRTSALEPSIPGVQSMTESYYEAWPETGGYFPHWCYDCPRCIPYSKNHFHFCLDGQIYGRTPQSAA